MVSSFTGKIQTVQLQVPLTYCNLKVTGETFLLFSLLCFLTDSKYFNYGNYSDIIYKYEVRECKSSSTQASASQEVIDNIDAHANLTLTSIEVSTLPPKRGNIWGNEEASFK